MGGNKYYVINIKSYPQEQAVLFEICPRAVGVPTNTQKLQRSEPCRLELRRFGQGPSYSTHCIVSQSAIIQENSAHGCRRDKYKTYFLLDCPWIIMS